MSETPVKVAVTGAAGQICYSLLFRIASGSLLGDRPKIKVLLNAHHRKNLQAWEFRLAP